MDSTFQTVEAFKSAVEKFQTNSGCEAILAEGQVLLRSTVSWEVAKHVVGAYLERCRSS